nr:hypothetical protein [Tanacetum cinerariifolium]
MPPYEMLYGRKCRTPVCWDEVESMELASTEVVFSAIKKIETIRERLKEAQDRKCLADESSMITLDDVEINLELTFQEEPVAFLGRKSRQLHNKEILLIKVEWKHQKGTSIRWEPKEKMRSRYNGNTQRPTKYSNLKSYKAVKDRSKVRVGIIPTKTKLALEQTQQGVSDEALNIIVILHSIHSDDGNPTSANIKQALRQNLVIEKPEHGLFFIDAFREPAFQRVNDIEKVETKTLLGYKVMALNVKTPKNQRFMMLMSRMIDEFPDKDNILNKRVKLESMGYTDV